MAHCIYGLKGEVSTLGPRIDVEEIMDQQTGHLEAIIY